jgi:predicted MFS family arabinose efflux permease
VNRPLLVPAGVGMIAVSFGLARYGYGLLLPDMRATLDLDVGTAGLIGSSAYLSYLLANTAVVGLMVRTGPRLPLALGTVSAAGGMLVIATAGDAGALAAGVLLAGASAGFAYPPYADVVVTAVSERRRSTAWATISSGTGWGVALAGPVAVLSGAGWRTTWLLFAAIAVLVGVVAVRTVPAGGVTTSSAPVRLRPRWFLCPRSRPLLLAAALVGVGSSIWWAFCVDAMRVSGVDATTARLVYAACGVAGVVASLTGALVDRAGHRRVHHGTVLGVAAALALLAWVATGPEVATTPLVALAAVTFGVTYNGVIAVQGLWSAEVFAALPSAGVAAVNTSLTAGTLVGPVLGGVVIGLAGYAAALGLAAAATLVALLLPPPADLSAARPSAPAATQRSG